MDIFEHSHRYEFFSWCLRWLRLPYIVCALHIDRSLATGVFLARFGGDPFQSSSARFAEHSLSRTAYDCVGSAGPGHELPATVFSTRSFRRAHAVTHASRPSFRRNLDLSEKNSILLSTNSFAAMSHVPVSERNYVRAPRRRVGCTAARRAF